MVPKSDRTTSPPPAPTGAADTKIATEEPLREDEVRSKATGLNFALEAIGAPPGFKIDASGDIKAVLVGVERADLFLEGFRVGKSGPEPKIKDKPETMTEFYDPADEAIFIPDEWKDPRFHYRYVNVTNAKVFHKRLRQGYQLIHGGNKLEAENIPNDVFNVDGNVAAGTEMKLARCPKEKVEARRAQRLRRHVAMESSIYADDPQKQLRNAIKSGALDPRGIDPRSPGVIWSKLAVRTTQNDHLRGIKPDPGRRVTLQDVMTG